MFVPADWAGERAVTATLEQIDVVHKMVARYPDRMALATTEAEVRQAWRDGKLASLMGAEGGHSIDCSLPVLRTLHALGVRYLTLTHNNNVPWADSATDEPVLGGLNDFGRSVVAELNRLGMLVDLSHVSPDTMRDALAVSESPVVFSHSSARSVCDSPRNVPDDVLATLAGNGGVCMVTFVPSFVSEDCREFVEQVRAEMLERGEDPRDWSLQLAATARYAADHPRPKATVRAGGRPCRARPGGGRPRARRHRRRLRRLRRAADRAGGRHRLPGADRRTGRPRLVRAGAGGADRRERAAGDGRRAHRQPCGPSSVRAGCDTRAMLSDADKALLDLEAKRFRQSGHKVAAIVKQLGLTEVRYYQRLNQLIDDPEALAYSPVVVNRVRRLRDKRARG